MPPRGTDPRVIEAPGRGLTGPRLLLALGCAAAGLLFGSRAVAGWADRLPEGFDTVRTAATAWNGTMQQAGLTAPYDALHRWVGRIAGPR
jgi:hypothetical protein